MKTSRRFGSAFIQRRATAFLSKYGFKGVQMISAIVIAAAVLSTGSATANAVWTQGEILEVGRYSHVIKVAQAVQTRRFDIPSQSLASALVAFGKQAGIQVSFKVQAVRARKSLAISRETSPRKALEELLKDSGLKFDFIGTSAVRIYRLNPVLAQAENGIFLDTIIISGEKLDRPFIETFTSVGVATEEDIETYSLDDLQDVFSTMANVRQFESSRAGNGFQIRGINADGVTQPDGNAPVISVIIDGVTQSGEGLKRGSRGTWDVQQIEVLRGPQSTLQGRNALAGAVVIKTNDPTYTPEGKVKGILGQFDRREGGVALSIPLIPNQLAARFSGEYRQDEADIDYVDPLLEPLGEDRYRNLRGKLLIEPNAIDPLSVLLTISDVHDKPGVAAATGPDFFDRRLIVPSAFAEFREMDVRNYSADTAYEFNERLTLRSVTAKNETSLDISSVPGDPLFLREDDRADDDFIQDIRLEIKEKDGRQRGLSGVVGAFYGDFDQKVDSEIVALNFFGPGFDVVVQDGTIENKTETQAVYADLRYRLNRWLSVVGGARYQEDEVTTNFDVDSAPVFGGPTIFDGSEDFSAWMPKYGVAVDLTDTQAIAVTASRGYRQGGTELIVGTNIPNVIEPEFMWTYEFAYRKSSQDKRLTFGANVFYNDYTDQQITLVNPNFPPFTNTFNAGESKSYGAEFEGRYDFNNGLNVFGSLGLLKTEFTKLEEVSCPGGSCTGNEYPEAPAVTFSFGGKYQHHSGVFASAYADYTSDYFAFGDVNNTPALKIDGRFVANAKVGYQRESLTASVYINNIFDKDYLTGLSSDATEGFLGEGRAVGFELRANF